MKLREIEGYIFLEVYSVVYNVKVINVEKIVLFVIWKFFLIFWVYCFVRSIKNFREIDKIVEESFFEYLLVIDIDIWMILVIKWEKLFVVIKWRKVRSLGIFRSVREIF